MDMNARFCRILLQQAMKDLTGREAEHFRENASAIRIDRTTFLFEWPTADMDDGTTLALEIEADSVTHAKANAICNWLEFHAERARAKNWPPRDVS